MVDKMQNVPRRKHGFLMFLKPLGGEVVGSLYPEQKQKSGNHLMQVKGLLFTVDVVSKARRGLSNKKMRFAETRLLEEPAIFSETWQRDATGTLNFEFFFLMHSGWYNAFTQIIQIDRERSDKLAKKEHVLVVTCNKVARWWEKFIFRFNRFKRVARWWQHGGQLQRYHFQWGFLKLCHYGLTQLVLFAAKSKRALGLSLRSWNSRSTKWLIYPYIFSPVFVPQTIPPRNCPIFTGKISASLTAAKDQAGHRVGEGPFCICVCLEMGIPCYLMVDVVINQKN